MKFPDLMEIREPTAEERLASGMAWYDRVSHTFIDRWPDSVRALSFPTKLISVDPEVLSHLWREPADEGVANELAARLDAEMGWTSWFVRLNSRSPKDAAYPVAPVTCSGKQAVSWIWASERCLDDTVCFANSGQPMFVCLREYEHIWPDAEIRCFAKGGKVLAVSRYFYDEAPKNPFDEAQIWDLAQAFYGEHLAHHYADIVFDLNAFPRPGQPPRLIEINPYGLSDPCLFGSYAAIEGEGGVRQYPQEPAA